MIIRKRFITVHYKFVSQMVKDTKQRVRSFWNANPCGTRYTKEVYLNKKFYEEIEIHRYSDHAYLKNAINVNSYNGKTVLEIGAGVGTDLRQFAKSGARVIGTDLTLNSVKITKKGFELFNLKGLFGIADAEDLPFEDKSFDLVYSCGVLHHTVNTQKAIDEVYRVLKPKGEAIIMLYNKRSWNYYINVLLFRGLILGKRFGRTKQKLINLSTDGEDCPLSKVYTKKQITNMFGKFKRIKIKIRYLPRRYFPLLNMFIPTSTFDKIGKHIGWNMFIFAEKQQMLISSTNLYKS